jgi:hypothetical protein
MFIGHFAVGFAAKRAVPRMSLAVLFTAAQLADLLWPVFLMLGFEQARIEPGNTSFTPMNFINYPYSHSLTMLAVWGVVFAALYGRPVRVKVNVAPALGTASGSGFNSTFVVLFALVISHWLFDFVTHRPDMPLYPGGPKVGLGLWNSTPLTVAVEAFMFVIGLWTYARATRARDRRGRWGLAGLAAVLVVVYVGNIVSPPPPTMQTVAVGALVGFVVLILWSWWVDRHREAILRAA